MSQSVVEMVEGSPTGVLPADTLWRMSVDQYHSMIAGGILTEDDRVELLDGMLVKKMTKNPPHAAATQLGRSILEAVAPAGWIVRAQEPITLEDSEPEPDLAVVRGSVRDFKSRHPSVAEVGLVVEVADASLSRDRGIKHRVYAKARVPVYWIVNLLDRRIEVYSSPSDLAYGCRRDYREGEAAPLFLDGADCGPIAVADCLP